MYTHDLNLGIVQTILWGYQEALRRNNLIERYSGRTFINMDFACWLCETREWSTSTGFADAISRHMQNREKAFALFIELVAEFRQSDPASSDQSWERFKTGG
jgi:hypothetical protein